MDNKIQGEFILNNSSDNKIATPVDEKSTQKEAPKHHKESNLHFYSAFGDHPSGITFAEQEKGEEIVLLLRRHFVTNVPWIATVLLLMLLPLLIPFVNATFPLPSLSTITIGLSLAFYYLILFGFVLLNFTLWYFHIGLITNMRVVDVDLAGLLYRQVTATRHENVEDVTYDQTGFISSLFNYGNVHIQTAGTQANVEFDKVPRPAKVADIIGDLSNPV